MQLPIDVKALIDEMTDIEAARNTPLSVSVFIDEEAPADLAAHVRNAFASTMPSVRMTVAYLDDTFMPHPTDDVAIITAGESAVIGPAATAIRAVGVPVMVVTTLPTAVAQKAEELGHAIPEGDLVSPEIESVGEEPYVLDDEVRAALDDRMGRWIVAACHDKRLALAIAFPFVRRPLARDAVQTTAIQNVGIGLVPILPGADLPVMTLNQAKMVLQIAAAYGYAMDKDRLKELGACVGSAFLFRTLAASSPSSCPFWAGSSSRALPTAAQLLWVMRSSSTSRAVRMRLALPPCSSAQLKRARRLLPKRGALPRTRRRSISLAR